MGAPPSSSRKTTPLHPFASGEMRVLNEARRTRRSSTESSGCQCPSAPPDPRYGSNPVRTGLKKEKCPWPFSGVGRVLRSAIGVSMIVSNNLEVSFLTPAPHQFQADGTNTSPLLAARPRVQAKGTPLTLDLASQGARRRTAAHGHMLPVVS